MNDHAPGSNDPHRLAWFPLGRSRPVSMHGSTSTGTWPIRSPSHATDAPTRSCTAARRGSSGKSRAAEPEDAR